MRAVLLAALVLASCAAAPAPVADDERALAGKVGFPESVLLEAKRHTAKPVSQLQGLDDDFESVAVQGLALSVPGDKALAALKSLRAALAPQGYLVFRSEAQFGHGPDTLAILKTQDQFDALRTMKTNGANFDIDTDRVVARLGAWHRQYGLDIYGAGLDFVEAHFVRQPPDMRAFAQEVYEFCPDVVDQGAGSVAALAHEMKRENMLYLWWD